MQYDIKLSDLRWRPKQRRLVSDLKDLGLYDEIRVEGKYHTIDFVYRITDTDPHTRTRKVSRVYKPKKQRARAVPGHHALRAYLRVIHASIFTERFSLESDDSCALG